ncbi:hypothetical protein TRICI_004355 [Trichomonascus ciferrii]|uniref:J domain-containing protein n=1 Tax=Trichomonascus ciferrii TaxID=44093 RepID=A0A642V7H1_9ASCO|nr:hypothetical protein TRICI_004355 [Trichomonascus ciferrii]
MSSSSSEKHSTSASNRSHNQGRQDRGYTPAQVKAVERVRKCKVTDYYAILDIEKPSSEAEIRKSYRKLALIMHPDKNCAPGADEAFKMISKAFQVLSDGDKKRIYDQTGMDPDSRGGGGPSGFSGFSRAGAGGGGGGPGMHFQGADISPEDLFNMFFGGGGGPAGAQFSGFGGGPGIRVHTFGGGSPFAFGGPNMRGARAQRGGAAPPQEEFSLRNLTQLLPLLLLFGLPILMSLFGDSTSGGYTNNLPTFKFHEKPPYVEQRTTPNHNIPYFVNPKETTNLNARKLNQLDRRAEVSYIQVMRSRCYDEYEYKQQKIADSKGWFSTDEEAYNAAINIPLASCEILDQLGVTYGR